MNWDTLDWAVLDRLRDRFLNPTPPAASYWLSPADLANYDLTYGQRIAWKWDAVLAELQRRRWLPPARTVFDWGCGSGLAGRRVVECFGPDHFEALHVFDRSGLAMDFARQAAKEFFPKLAVECADSRWLEGSAPIGVLVVSHVLNELPPHQRDALLRLAARAEAVLWVEPGTLVDSRALIAVREALHDRLDVVAPCTHQAACGLLTPDNDRHWCHHFASPPPNIMADPRWVQFAQRAGIDLRRLPYSFLVLEQKERRVQTGFEPGPPISVAGCSRIIGAPRVYKPFARILSCQAEGVRDLILQKRDAPELFQQMKKSRHEPVYRWALEGNQIKAGQAVISPAPSEPSASSLGSP